MKSSLYLLPLLLFAPAIYLNEINRGGYIAPTTAPTASSFLSSTVIEKRIDATIGAVEQGLERARASIRRARASIRSKNGNGFVPRGSIYRNPQAFYRSYIEMEKRFKVWVYKEGNPPIFHTGPMNGLYATEGHFMSEITRPKSPFAARCPEEAHVFYIPISVFNVIIYVYKRKQYTYVPLKRIADDYIDVIKRNHRFWNRTSGADHFMVACHDWGPMAFTRSEGLIRVLCNANTSEGFDPRRDATLPEINIFADQISQPNHPDLSSPSTRSIVAFFAGRDHGPVRPILFHHWGNYTGNDVVVYEHVPKGVEYSEMMRKSMFCLCPSGYEVASPRIVEAIYAGCVPVIISKAYVLPFNDVFDWSKMSIEIPIERIAEIKTILQAVSRRKYLMLYKRVLQVQKHFVINVPAQRYDVFHMTLHSLWLRRLDLRLSY
ncbi:UDP-Xyl: xylogalacturonan beta-1,3-xylosyltransferase, family GT47 [Zostera marina]|uniref:UDP-Xyl: xylogalacturonan beta-1,3-xylosyltransferase, family GT47 n=1 Tax=Zostera marina TaxID=29655 RepID=A0A0K9Q4C0_ZOSMR|nr:UDP-Xyl: xylogalacturonan beta-1,3-xylosyltransferase, family GT47 [Zostera marina]